MCKKQNINPWRPTLYKLYPHMTPLTHKFVIIGGNFNPYPDPSLISDLNYDEYYNMKYWVIRSS